MHELLITVFLFLTAPVSANLLAKEAYRRRACDGTAGSGRHSTDA